MKNILGVCKRWFAEVADLRAKQPLLIVIMMRDNHDGGENTSKEFTENGAKNYFSTPNEQWQIQAERLCRVISRFGKHAW